MWWMLVGCSGSPTKVASPAADEQTVRAAVDALCKLFEGADMTCARGPTGLMVDGRTFGVSAKVLSESSTGIVSLRGVIQLEDKQATWKTRLRGFGSTKTEALNRGMHEWALVSGTAVVDAWVNPDARHALKAVESGEIQPLVVAGSRALRGWTLFRPKGVLEHNNLLKAVAPALGEQPKGVLSFEVTHEGASADVACFLDGEPNEAVCAKAKAFAWPSGSYELRTTYVLLP